MFTLPEQLPDSITELEALLHEAEQEFDTLAEGLADENVVVTEETLTRMRELNEASEKLTGAIGELRAEDDARLEEARRLAEARAARATTPDEEPTEEEEAPAEEPTEDTPETEQPAETEQREAVAAGAKPPSFRGLGKASGKTPAKVAPKPEIGFRMSPGANKYKDGLVGYHELAVSLDSMAPGSTIRANRDAIGGKVAHSLATLDRGFDESQVVSDPTELVDAITEATKISNYKAPTFTKDGAIAASGGWCAPSETIYEFCDVPPVADVISLPEINMTRGGIRWPLEPDFTELYATLPFRFTEAQLTNATPPTKPCVEIPCPAMDEIRPEAIGLCITAGILQRRGWPELIAKFLAETMLAHQHKLSAWTIADMVADSTAVTFGDAAGFAAAGSSLNALDLAATNIRLLERLPRAAVVEGVAPSWYPAVLRADLAYNTGRESKAVTDAEVDDWLSARNIRLQYVADWQTRGAGLPGVAATVAWPATVQILLYPAGAWFRHLSNVIEVGTLYDKAQLQQNRYTELFTEDEYFTARRCRTSQVVTIPICANGAIGERVALTCGTNT